MEPAYSERVETSQEINEKGSKQLRKKHKEGRNRGRKLSKHTNKQFT